MNAPASAIARAVALALAAAALASCSAPVRSVPPPVSTASRPIGARTTDPIPRDAAREAFESQPA
ncbi:MAG: hypothetical protein ACKOJI_03765, partial [Phycisphaerales bacterium]